MANDPWSRFKAFADAAGQNGAPAAQWAGMAERFSAAARSYLAEAARGPAGAASEAAKNFSNVLRDQALAFFQFPWSIEPATPAAPGTPLGEMVTLGLTREQQQRGQRAAEAARRVAEAQRRLQYLWSDALRDASGAFAAQILAEPPRSLGSLRRLYDAWIDCAEKAYADMAHGAGFCAALAEFVNAGSLWRREFAADLEHWSKLIDLPTRSELNSLHARVQSIESELRTARPRAAPKRPAGTRRRAPTRPKRAPKS